MQKFTKQSSDKKLMVTNDYEKFHHLLGQRNIQEQVIRKIVDSIREVGYITSPVIVNERYEVIDGQHRVKALERLKMPVEYIVHPGAGIAECINMNIIQAKWRIIDYINAFCDLGNSDYIKLMELIKKYDCLPIDAIARACGYGSDRALIKGNFVFPESNYDYITKELEWLSTFSLLYSEGYVKGRPDVFYAALLFCYQSERVDNKRLENKLLETPVQFPAYSNIKNCLKILSDIYNNKMRGPLKVYLDNDYQVSVDMARFNTLNGPAKE